MENGQNQEFKYLTFCQTKIHRSLGCLDFLKKCKRFEVLPRFTEVTKSTLNEVNWGKSQIRSRRLDKLDSAIVEQENRLEKKQNEI